MKDNVELIKEAWNQYVGNNVLDVQIIRPEVANSWQRCRNLNVDPYKNPDTDIRGMELKERLFKLQNLVNIARPFMENLYNFVKGSGFQVVLSDDQGFLLEVIGDSEIMNKTSEVQMVPGGNWNETAKGTNAIGTAIVERKPVQILAFEHYCKDNHFLTCSASPIFDTEGKIIGILDISGDYKVANPHTLGMVVAAVNAIENQLRLQEATKKLFMAYKYNNTIIDSMSEGVVTIDNNGIITRMNNWGGRLLEVNPQDSVGLHVNNIFKMNPPMLEVLNSGIGYQDKEIKLDRLGKKLLSSATPIRDEYGKIIGAVANMREGKEKTIPRRTPGMQAKYVFDDITGTSPSITEAKKWAQLAADSSSTVLLVGESGTGKELFAQAIHNGSTRQHGPFVAINCAALPETLIESELFGYEEGAFTGSKKGGQLGKFELANGGTIFLDEIGDMPLNTQAKLLRVIQEKRVGRIGGVGEIPVDIRIIAATNKDLKTEVDNGTFREDLFYRLNVILIKIPALRERMEDLPQLAKELVLKLSVKMNKPNIYLEDSFLEKVSAHTWPGNIRELENAIERAVNLVGDYGALTGSSLPFHTQNYSDVETVPIRTKEVKSLKDMEKESIVDALKLFNGNISKAAKNLGIGRNTLYRKIKEYSIKF